MSGFSCEHCGRHEADHAERSCEYCAEGMCFECTERHDEKGMCPNATVGQRTRLWLAEDHPHTSTGVQFRTDVEPKVWMHTNIGWVPIGNAPRDEAEAEAFAIEIAEGYDLMEMPEERARYMAGWED